MSEKTLVLGATGNVGRPLIQALIARGEATRAASRSGAAVGGAEGVVFDYANADTHEAAFDGITRAYVLLPTGYVDSLGLLSPVIQALAQRNAKIVLQSVFGVDADDAIPYRQVERSLERSGVPYVILRPNWFADNFHTFWKAGIDHGQIALPAAQGQSSFIDARDIAASAVAALTQTTFDGQAFDLTGPQAHSYQDAAAILSEVTGRSIAYSPIDDATFIQRLAAGGVPANYAAFLASIFHPVREGWTARVTDAVTTLTGQPARSLRTYAQDHALQLLA